MRRIAFQPSAEQTRRMIAALFAAYLLASQVGTVAAGAGVNINGP